MTPRYTLDPGASRFTVRAFASGLLSMIGHDPVITVGSFQGEVGFDPDAHQESFLRMRIEADSLTVENGQVKEKDRLEIEKTMKEEVLEVHRYTEIVFSSTQVTLTQLAPTWFRASLQGRLQLHGVTRPQSIDLSLRLKGDSLSAEGDFTLKQTDFGIQPVTVAGGALRLKDELKCSFNIVAHKSPFQAEDKEAAQHVPGHSR